MGRHCFVANCKANKFRYLTDRNKKLPAFFRFPKDADLFEKWKSVVPQRVFRTRVNTRQCPTEKDHLCSLHFKEEDVIKYYEISSIKGCPKTEVVKIERGTWTLKPDAVPCYFYDDNPNAKQMLHGPRVNLRLAKDSSHGEVPATLGQTSDECEENTPNFGTESSGVKDKPEPVLSKMSSDPSMDHNYHLPSSAFSAHALEPDQINIDVGTSNPRSLNSNSPSIKCEINCDLYSIEQLHQDVLEIALPKTWTFVQNDDDYSTQFISYDEDMSEKCVKFLGSCLPLVTIRNSVLECNRVNSKQDIEKLLVTVNVL